MTHGTCSVGSCERPHYGNSYCQLHYNRVRLSGSPGSQEPHRRTPEGLCSVAGCGRQARTRGWCRGHYQRVHRTGVPGPADLSAAVAGASDCAVSECGRTATRKGYCAVHYRRWRQSGDPGPPEVLAVSVGDEAGYAAVHARLRASRGPANGFMCQHCGQPADDWAYDHSDVVAKWDVVREMLYSLDLDRYLSLCKQCHVTMDRSKALASTVLPEQWPVIRSWAKRSGWNVSVRGRLARRVIMAYLEAHSSA